MSQQDPIESGRHVAEGGVTLFEEMAERRVRRVWHEGRWFFSVIDVIGLLTDTSKPRQYWFDMKRYVHDEGFAELSEKIRQLKMPSADGKQRLTDAADAETILRIVQSIPSPKAEPFKQWLARVGTERLEEMEDPTLAADRLRRLYKKQGYSDAWISERLKNVVIRNEVTTEWHERGAEEGREFAILTDTLHRGAFDLSVEDHKVTKSLKRRDNLRDSMTTIELALSSLAEATSTVIHQARDSQGFEELQLDAHEAGEVAGATRKDIETRTGRPVVSSENYKQLRAARLRELQPSLIPDATDETES